MSQEGWGPPPKSKLLSREFHMESKFIKHIYFTW